MSKGKLMLVPKAFVECPVMKILAAQVNFPYAAKSFNELPSGRRDDMMHGMHTCFGDNLRKFAKMKQTMGKCGQNCML